MSKKNKLGVALVKRACKLCGKSYDAEVVLNTRLTENMAEKVEKMHGQTIGYMEEPCDECKDLMSKGFLLIGIIESLTDDPNNPYRSGHIWVITHEASKEIFTDMDLSKGAAMIDIEAAKQIGLL